VDVVLDELHTRLIDGVDDEGATLDRFSVQARNGYFSVSGAVSKSEGTVNFSFRVVPSMFHTRPGANFQYARRPRYVHSRTWAALDFRIEGVETNVDRSWWVILFGEVIGAIYTAGLSILYVEGLVSAAASSFGGRIMAAKPGAPAARIQRTIPPPGGTAVRIGLDQFDVTDSGVYVGISVRATPSPTACASSSGRRPSGRRPTSAEIASLALDQGLSLVPRSRRREATCPRCPADRSRSPSSCRTGRTWHSS
jgi:hypothetical protein